MLAFLWLHQRKERMNDTLTINQKLQLLKTEWCDKSSFKNVGLEWLQPSTECVTMHVVKEKSDPYNKTVILTMKSKFKDI